MIKHYWYHTIVPLVTLVFLCTFTLPAQVTWMQSTVNGAWTEKSLKLANLKDIPVDATILLNEEQQQVDGFGACFNELGWTALSVLEDKEREAILKHLFDPKDDLKLNICRMPVGANDYARNYYSLNDSADDFEMKYFSITRDREMLIPYIKAALKYRPDLAVWGSPWTPPYWMKTNNHYACRPDVVNDMTPEQAGQEGITQFRMEPAYLEAYAKYFVKYIQAYYYEGIYLTAIHVQNEMNSCQNFPSCIWTATDLGTFIGKYLGPAMSTGAPSTEIWYGTVERPSVEKIDTIMQDPLAASFIYGISFQWAGKQAIPGVRAKYPHIRLMQSETECGDGSNDWTAAEYTFSLMKHYFDHGVSVYSFWNSVLDETGKSMWGWKQNSMITVDSKTRNVTYNPEYYLLKHFSHFIRPGAKKVRTSGSDSALLAFVNPDGSVVVVLANTADQPEIVQLALGNKLLSATLEPHSLNTFTMKSPVK